MYTLEVDDIPPPLNAFYAGMYHFKRAKIAKEWHEYFYWAAIEVKLPKPLKTPVTLSATVYCKGTVRDADSAVVAAKFAGDALVRAGYLPDDSPKYVTEVRLRCEKGKANRTKIEIYEV